MISSLSEGILGFFFFFFCIQGVSCITKGAPKRRKGKGKKERERERKKKEEKKGKRKKKGKKGGQDRKKDRKKVNQHDENGPMQFPTPAKKISGAPN